MIFFLICCCSVAVWDLNKKAEYRREYRKLFASRKLLVLMVIPSLIERIMGIVADTLALHFYYA